MERLALSSAGAAGGGGPNLAQAMEQGLVVAGPSSYHRPDCKLLEGRGVLPTVTVEAAQERGLAPCRACDAADFSLPVSEPDPEMPRRRRSRSSSS